MRRPRNRKLTMDAIASATSSECVGPRYPGEGCVLFLRVDIGRK